jgi:hypothetical protein
MRKTKETSIDGERFRMKQLGGETSATLGFAIVEALIKKTGIADSMKALREALVISSEVFVANAWVPMGSIDPDDWWGERPDTHGAWLAWAVNESGLPSFLLGVLKRMSPKMATQLRSIFQSEPSGSSTDSSSPSASKSQAGAS